jgi:RNA polymerase sigma-70 factor (ECF subfamily)
MGVVSRSLCRDANLSEEILQEALCKAWGSRTMFRRGSNLKAWLLTILRNTYYSHNRRAWRHVSLDENLALRIAGPEDEQVWAVHLSDTVEALRELSLVQREALLVRLGGLTYEDAAAMCHCSVGTAKSRVARARMKVLAVLEDSGRRRAGRIPIGLATYQIMQEIDELVGSASGR